MIFYVPQSHGRMCYSPCHAIIISYWVGIQGFEPRQTHWSRVSGTTNYAIPHYTRRHQTSYSIVTYAISLRGRHLSEHSVFSVHMANAESTALTTLATRGSLSRSPLISIVATTLSNSSTMMAGIIYPATLSGEIEISMWLQSCRFQRSVFAGKHVMNIQWVCAVLRNLS